jgi:KDEL-tailed cysteine endopeptidase
MAEYGVDHTEEEYYYRLAVYLENREMIRQHNSENHSFWLGLNQFADLPHWEFKELYTKKMVLTSPKNIVTFDDLEEVSSSKVVDWVAKGAVTPV